MGSGKARVLHNITANAVAHPLHERMPVIIGPEEFSRCFDPKLKDRDAVKNIPRPSVDGVLLAEPISTLVNNPRHEVPERVVLLDSGQCR